MQITHSLAMYLQCIYIPGKQHINATAYTVVQTVQVVYRLSRNTSSSVDVVIHIVGVVVVAVNVVTVVAIVATGTRICATAYS